MLGEAEAVGSIASDGGGVRVAAHTDAALRIGRRRVERREILRSADVLGEKRISGPGSWCDAV